MQPEDNQSNVQPTNVHITQPANVPPMENTMVVSSSFSDSNTTPTSHSVDAGALSGNRRGSHRALKAILAIVVIGSLLATGYVLSGGVAKFNSKHVSSAAVDYIHFLNDGKEAMAYQASSSNLRNSETESQFTLSVGDLSAKNPKFSKESVQIKGDKAVYTATVDGLPPTGSGRTDGIFTLALVKHGLTTWQVDSIQIN